MGTWEHRLFTLYVGYVCLTGLAVVSYTPVANLPCHSRKKIHSTPLHSMPFHSTQLSYIPFHSTPYLSITPHSMAFHSVPVILWHSVLCHYTSLLSTSCHSCYFNPWHSTPLLHSISLHPILLYPTPPHSTPLYCIPPNSISLLVVCGAVRGYLLTIDNT